MAMKYVRTQQDGGVLVATLHHPPRNFLRTGMVYEIREVMAQAGSDETVKVVVLTGGVEGYFIAHADLEAVRSTDPTNEGSVKHYLAWHAMMDSLGACPAVVIAAVNGHATGGGCEVALAADLRFMARGPYLTGLLESQLNILAGSGGTQRMARLLGVGRALELMLEGRLLSPEEALAAGLVNRTYPAGELLPRTMEYAQRLASRPRAVLSNIKQAVRLGMDLPLPQALARERELFLPLVASPEAQARLAEAARLYVEQPDAPFPEIMRQLGVPLPPHGSR